MIPTQDEVDSASEESEKDNALENSSQFSVVDVTDAPEAEPPLEDNPYGNGKYWGLCPCNKGMGATINISCSFFLVLFSFNVTSNFQTSLRGDLGYYALGVIYVFFALSSLCGSFIMSAIGNKWALFVGSFLYAFFPLSNLYPKAWSLILSGILCGMGAGPLWTSQGDTITRCAKSKKELGFYSGLFFSIYQTNQLIGNLVGAVLLNACGETRVFIVLTVISVLGSLVLLPLRLPFKNKKESNANFKKSLKETFAIMKTKKMMWLYIPFLFGGTYNSYYGGKFTAICGKKYVGYIMASFGASNVISSVTCGKVSDIIGKKPVLIFAVCACYVGSILGYVISFISPDPNESVKTSAVILMFIAGISLGMLDSIICTLYTAIIGSIFPENAPAAFSAYRFIQSVITGIWYVCSAYVSMLALMIVICVFGILLIVDIFLLDKYVCPIDFKQQEQEEYEGGGNEEDTKEEQEQEQKQNDSD